MVRLKKKKIQHHFMKHINVPIHYNIEDNLTKKQNDDVIFLFWTNSYSVLPFQFENSEQMIDQSNEPYWMFWYNNVLYEIVIQSQTFEVHMKPKLTIQYQYRCTTTNLAHVFDTMYKKLLCISFYCVFKKIVCCYFNPISHLTNDLKYF